MKTSLGKYIKTQNITYNTTNITFFFLYIYTFLLSYLNKLYTIYIYVL